MMSATNARQGVVIDYCPDPHNPAARLVADACARLHGGLVPAVAGGDTDPGGQWHGDTLPPQGSITAATQETPTTPVHQGGYAEIGSAATGGPTTDPVMRTFASRLARQRPL